MGFEFRMTGSNIVFFFQASSLDYTWELFYPLYFPGKKKKKKAALSLHRMKYSPKICLGEYCPSRATFKILECCLVNIASNSVEKRPLSVCR